MSSACTGPAEKVPVESAVEMSAEIKQVAAVFGADKVGITRLDRRWLYSHKYSAQTRAEKPTQLPADLENVIVIAQEMGYPLIQTAPSALSGAATGLGYSKDALVLLSLAQYIRNLGYQAVASLNDTALAVPLAVQAGLGEYGRLGFCSSPWNTAPEFAWVRFLPIYPWPPTGPSGLA
jgi:hypothetical protein